MSVIITLSRKRTPQNIIAKGFFKAAILAATLVLLASCGSQRPQVVTTKKRPATPVTKTQNTVVDSRTSTPSTPIAATKPARSIEIIEKNQDQETVSIEVDTTRVQEPAPLAARLIEIAETYLGVRYRYAGNSYKGIDCSGLMNQVFYNVGIQIPRTSGSIMNVTEPILLDHAKPGDMVFFATGRNRSRVSHVGLVTRVVPGDVEFIHASTSQGVIKSMLSERYWTRAFLRAGRIEE